VLKPRSDIIAEFVVTAAQMRAIEERVFAAGMPVAALMEKVGERIAQHIQHHYPDVRQTRLGILVGPGHNGGDALVVARELSFRGYAVKLYHPFTKAKELTANHAQYAVSLGLPFVEQIEDLRDCDLLIDGLFGFGLERSLNGAIAADLKQINAWRLPVISIDLPSGLHTDTGAVLGTAIRATHTWCLGLWKLGLLQDQALAWIGQAELIDFDLPLADIDAVIGETPQLRRITAPRAIAALPLHRPPDTHKYKMGHLLIIAGSRQYMGAAILAGLGARASGVGMLSIAVPDGLKPILLTHLPEALVIGCPETDTGALTLPPDLEQAIQHHKYSVIACGPGLTLSAIPAVQTAIASSTALVLDADGLNSLATLGTTAALRNRAALTVLTPHPGEFRRLFPDLGEVMDDRVAVVQQAAQQTGTVVLLKGARVAIANPTGTVWLNPESTPALARGGSGDVLTGLLGGLLAQAIATDDPEPESGVYSAVWWHAQAGRLAAQACTELGVDALTLSQYLIPALRGFS
jgi:NAD(P)H-hydrate epimerase